MYCKVVCCVIWKSYCVFCEDFILCYVKVLAFLMCITVTNGLAALRQARCTRFASVQGLRVSVCLRSSVKTWKDHPPFKGRDVTPPFEMYTVHFGYLPDRRQAFSSQSKLNGWQSSWAREAMLTVPETTQHILAYAQKTCLNLHVRHTKH